VKSALERGYQVDAILGNDPMVLTRSLENYRKFHYDATVITNQRPEMALVAIDLVKKHIKAKKIVLISSDLVYRPSNIPKPEFWDIDPVTDEGRMFARSEEMLDIYSDIIFRTGYIIGLCSINLYTNILNLARSGMDIVLSRRTVRNFIRNNDLSTFILESIERNITGVYNVASDIATEYDFAQWICSASGLNCKIKDSGEDLGNYSMDTSKALKTFGFRPSSVLETYMFPK